MKSRPCNSHVSCADRRRDHLKIIRLYAAIFLYRLTGFYNFSVSLQHQTAVSAAAVREAVHICLILRSDMWPRCLHVGRGYFCFVSEVSLFAVRSVNVSVRPFKSEEFRNVVTLKSEVCALHFLLLQIHYPVPVLSTGNVLTTSSGRQYSPIFRIAGITLLMSYKCPSVPCLNYGCRF